jgi:hypothetical protein
VDRSGILFGLLRTCIPFGERFVDMVSCQKFARRGQIGNTSKAVRIQFRYWIDFPFAYIASSI